MSFFDDQNRAGYRYMQRSNAYEILDLAITGRTSVSRVSAPAGVCRPQIVKVLLEAQLPPRSIDLSNAAQVPCPDVMRVILAKLSDSEILEAEGIFVNSIKERLANKSIRPNVNPLKWDEALKILNPKEDSKIQEELASLRNEIDKRVYKPLRDAKENVQSIETQYGMKFCSNSNLFAVEFMSNETLESNCIYLLPSNYLRVIQVLEKGILLSQTHSNQYTLDKVIFVKTKKQHVDGELVQSVYIKSSGVFSYNTVLGAGKTVHAFQDLAD